MDHELVMNCFQNMDVLAMVMNCCALKAAQGRASELGRARPHRGRKIISQKIKISYEPKTLGS